MKNKMIKLTVATALAVAFTQAVHATAITGSISMSGSVVANNTLLGSATAVTSVTGVTVGGIPSGAFAGTVGDSVTWVGFAFSGGSASPLWTFTDAGTGWTYSFNLTSDSVANQSNSFLDVEGSGNVTITGTGSTYVQTPIAWSFTITQAGGNPSSNMTFTFADNNQSVPDGGTTVLLLGSALSGLALLKRKLVS